MPVLGVTRDVALFLTKLDRTNETGALLDAVHQFTASSAGLNVYAAWRMPVLRTNMGDFKVGENVFPHASVPAAYWPEFWPLSGANGTSPSSQLAMLTQRAMTLTEAMRVLNPSAKQRWLYNLLHKHHLRDLLYCPVGRSMLTFWSSKPLQLNWEARAALRYVAHSALARMDELVVAKKIDGKVVPLSAREAEVLRLASRGLRASAIADTLEIAEDTIRQHLKNATKKLGAKSPMHAACQAIRLHLIA